MLVNEDGDLILVRENSGPHYNTKMVNITNRTYYDDIIENAGVRYGLVTIHAVAILLAALGNGSVVYFIIKYRRLRSNVTAFLVLNLAVCDLIGATVHQPMRLVDILLPFSENNGTITLSETYCQITGFFSSFFSGVGIHTVLMISQERLLLICYPLKAKGIITVTRTMKAITGVWILSFCALLPLPIAYTHIALIPLKHANVTMCMSDIFDIDNHSSRMYYFFLFFLYFTIPVLVISITYMKIFHTLHQTLQGTDNRDKVVEKVMKTRKNLAKMMLLIAVVFIILHSPFFITFLFLSSLGFQIPTHPIFTLIIIEFLPLLNAVFNPFIYCAHSRTFFRQKMISFLSTAGDLEESMRKRNPLYNSQSTINSMQMTPKPERMWINGVSRSMDDVQV